MNFYRKAPENPVFLVGRTDVSVGAPGTVTTAEAADLIKALKPHVVYPNHYLKANPDDIKSQMTTPGVEIRKRYWY